MSTVRDDLFARYLDAVARAAADLPSERREELLSEIREHLGSAERAGDAGDEAAARTVLDRLGEPEEIAAAARDEAGLHQPGDVREWRQPGRGHETAAVLMLTVGSLLPVLGWLVGVALLWTSQRWRTREKVLGTLIVPGGPGLILIAGAMVPGSLTSCSGESIDLGTGLSTTDPQVCTTASNYGIGVAGPLLLAAALLSIMTAVLLYVLARRRVAAAEPVRAVAGSSPWGRWRSLVCCFSDSAGC